MSFQAAWDSSFVQQPPAFLQQHQQQFQQPSMFGQQRFGGSSFLGGVPQQQQQPGALDKGKGREVNWEDQFNQYAQATGAGAEEEKEKVEEPKVDALDELEE